MSIAALCMTLLTLTWLVAKDPNPVRTFIALGSFVFDLVAVGQYL